MSGERVMIPSAKGADPENAPKQQPGAKKPSWWKRQRFMLGVICEIIKRAGKKNVRDVQGEIGATREFMLQAIITDWGKVGRSVFLRALRDGGVECKAPGLNCWRGPKDVDNIAEATLATWESILKHEVLERDTATGEIRRRKVSVQDAIRINVNMGRAKVRGQMSHENLAFVVNVATRFQGEVDEVVGTVEENLARDEDAYRDEYQREFDEDGGGDEGPAA